MAKANKNDYVKVTLSMNEESPVYDDVRVMFERKGYQSMNKRLFSKLICDLVLETGGDVKW